MNKQFTKDLNKAIRDTRVGELTPGSTPRRYEPRGGIQKHNERIHRESKYADTHKNLPFSFSKPPKSSSRSKYVECDNCKYITSVSVNTVGMVCPECKKYSSVTEVPDE